jgi:hypothetical protein
MAYVIPKKASGLLKAHKRLEPVRNPGYACSKTGFFSFNLFASERFGKVLFNENQPKKKPRPLGLGTGSFQTLFAQGR